MLSERTRIALVWALAVLLLVLAISGEQHRAQPETIVIEETEQ